MRRAALLLALSAAAALAVGGAQAAGPGTLPSHTTPNGTGSIVVPVALSTPPAAPAQRSYDQLLGLWKAAGAAYGVPWEVLGAINKIESNFGRNMGPSSAGAVGWMQFMPSTWMRWGMDADGDGVANPWVPEDAIYSAARYLAAAGAQEDLYRGVFAYNHADWYVRDVLELAQVFAGGGGFDATLIAGADGSTLGFSGGGGGGAEIVFRLDALEERLAKARRAVNRERRELLAVEEQLPRLDALVLRAEQRAGDPSLSDAEFQALEERVTRLVLRKERAAETLARARGELQAAVEHLEDVRRSAETQANTVTFSRSVAPSLTAPELAGGYVFPVGGGPSVVSVAATHHDYPAADIAAPEGSPLFAVADGIVTESFPSGDGRCGIGFQIQIANGKTFVYCHLSYLEPSVVPGAALAAGDPVGLVGSTGNSTGPHLHLQYVPATGYPQNEAWFQAFAGTAFRWQGEAAPPAPLHGGGDVISFSR